MWNRRNHYGLLKVAAYLPRFVSYVLRQFPSARVAMVVAALGVILEYAALTVMLPLVSEKGSYGAVSSMVVETWRSIAVYIGLPDQPRTWLWLFLLLLGLRIATAFIQITLNTWVSKRILAHLSGGTFSRVVMHEPLAEIYRRTVGHYTALAGDESVRVGQVFFYFAQTVSALISAVIGLVILLIFSPFVFKLTLLFLLLSAVFLGLTMKYVFSWSSESALLSREANTTFIEAFNGIRSIRSMAGEEFVVLRYRNFINRYGRILFLLDAFNYGSRSIPGLILIALGLIVLFPSAGFVPEFSAVYFFTVTTMLIRVLSFFGAAISAGGRIAIDIRGAFDLDEIIGDPSAPVQPAIAKKIVTSVGSISMSKLSCGYVSGHPVLTAVSGKFEAGSCYALVGQSGSGKSTLSDVLLGLLTPMAGELRIENVPYDQIDLASLRHKVVLVEQQTRIFSGSVRENIAFGLEVTEAQIKMAVEAAGLSEFISSLPNGLETLLDYQGANFSGGQRQRIGLARAIVRQPDVLILDEATSALDGATRDLVVQHLRMIFKDKILIFITHDNHVIQVVDEIWQIKKGKLKIEERTVAE